MVGLFRSPAQRLLSAYYQEGGPHGVHHTARGSLTSPVAYAHYCADGTSTQCAANKQCSYVIGRSCRSASDLHEAVSRLLSGSFVFVGLTELWKPSVCLFHRLLGGGARPTEFEPSRVNAGASGTGSEKRAGKYDEAQLGDYRDDFDEVLYAFARVKFLRQLQTATSWRCAIEPNTNELMCQTTVVRSSV